MVQRNWFSGARDQGETTDKAQISNALLLTELHANWKQYR
jgi:hypothetical protein